MIKGILHLKRSSSVVFFVWSHLWFSASLIDILYLASLFISLLMKSCASGGGVAWPLKQLSSTMPREYESNNRWSQPLTIHHSSPSNLPCTHPVYSGARYFFVPSPASTAFERPKSMMMGSPSLFWRRMLSGFMSR